MDKSFTDGEQALLKQMGADFTPLPPGAVGPEVSPEDLAAAAAELAELMADFPALQPVVREAHVLPYGILRWLRRPSPEVIMNGRLVSPFEWLERGMPTDVLIEIAAALHPS